jgi:hypothetical protein
MGVVARAARRIERGEERTYDPSSAPVEQTFSGSSELPRSMAGPRALLLARALEASRGDAYEHLLEHEPAQQVAIGKVLVDEAAAPPPRRRRSAPVGA